MYIHHMSEGHRYPPVQHELSIREPKSKAVGIPALWRSLRHLGKYMDVPEAIKAALQMNQQGGFDCPGCAWPDPDDDRSSLGEYCENGIKALAEEASKTKADEGFWKKHGIAELSTWSEYELGKSGRITHPMYLNQGGTHYEPISWDAAFALIAKHLHALHHPDEAIFYTSGRTSNEAAFLYGALARMYGTNNLPDCSNMCHECSGRALNETLGIGKGSVTLEDLYEADLIIVMGQNPGTNHPRMMTALERCKENGGRIVAVNPLKEAGLVHYTNPQSPQKILTGGSSLADHYLQVRINGDIALLKGVMLELYRLDQHSGEVLDHAFIRRYTAGYEAFKSSLLKYNIKQCALASGVSVDQIKSLASLIAARPKMIICWAMGITQHTNGVDNVREIVNLLLLRGSMGKKGAGPCPVRGHSNVQGDRTMGIWEQMPDSFLDRLEEAFRFRAPRKHGFATVPAIQAMHAGKSKVFVGMGGNFIAATPDTDYTAAALRKCDLTVHISTKPNRSHLVHGKEALILPTLGRSEIDVQSGGYQFVSVENSMGIVHSSKGVLPPRSPHLRSEVAIICGIAKQLFEGSRDIVVDWDGLCSDYDRIREKIEAVVPGFDRYNERVRTSNGFYLPNGVKHRSFNTSSGKALFSINEIPVEHTKDTWFKLMTIRAHDQYNTTLYGLDDVYRGVKRGREVVFMHPKDMRSLGVSAGDEVDISSHYGGIDRRVLGFKVVPYDIPIGCLAAYFPEANPLIPIDLYNDETFTPSSKSVEVRIRPIK